MGGKGVTEKIGVVEGETFEAVTEGGGLFEEREGGRGEEAGGRSEGERGREMEEEGCGDEEGRA